MRTLTLDQKKQLAKLNLEEFKKECVDDLESLGMREKGYPTTVSNFPRFVEEAYRKAKYYNLKTEKEIKVFLLASHVGGKKFINDPSNKIILSSYNCLEKIRFLKKYINNNIE